MAHNVKCTVCGKTFDRDRVQAVKAGPRRYAHYKCYPQGEKVPMESPVDEELVKLEEYIKNLLKDSYNPARVKKQLKQFTSPDYGYSYSGILKSLVWFYEVKKNPVAQANGGIGIVPYVYQDAYRYYYEIWAAQQRNEHKLVEEFVNEVEEIHIPVPQRKERKRNLFSFLDEEEEEE